MGETINVGLIGFGVGGQVFHAPLITSVPGLHLAKIKASRKEQVAQAVLKYPQAEIVPAAEDIFNDATIRLVVISTPNTSHYSLTKMALLAGKHVVVDKPFTIDTKEADELIELAATRKQLLTVYQNRRLDSDFITIQKLLGSKLLGNLAEFESRYDRFRNFMRPGAWREEEGPGAGIFYDLGAHLIDQCLVLFGLPEAVTADLRIQRKDARVTDNFELILHYARLKVTVKAGMLVREALPRFILNGDLGSFVKYGMDVQEEALKAGEKPGTIKNWGIEPPALWGRLNTEYAGIHFIGNIESEAGNYAAFYQNVYNAITINEDLQVTALQARNTVRIIELGIQSSEEKRMVKYSF